MDVFAMYQNRAKPYNKSPAAVAPQETPNHRESLASPVDDNDLKGASHTEASAIKHYRKGSFGGSLRKDLPECSISLVGRDAKVSPLL